jgi:hypothetical protein
MAPRQTYNCLCGVASGRLIVQRHRRITSKQATTGEQTLKKFYEACNLRLGS